MMNHVFKVSLWLMVLWMQQSMSASKYKFRFDDQPCFVKGLVGEQPDGMCRMERFLKRVGEIGRIEDEAERIEKEKFEHGRAYMLWGPSGIGKTMALEIVAQETGVAMMVYSAADLSKQIEETQDANGVMMKIYKKVESSALRERKPIIIVFDQLDKVLKKHPRFVNEIGGVLKGQIDGYGRSYGNNPYITTVVVGHDRFPEFDPSVHLRFFLVEWEQLTVSERAEMITHFDPSISPFRAHLLALITSKFTGGELKKVMLNAQELKKEEVTFPLMRSYWQEASVEKHYRHERFLVGVAAYSVLLATLFLNREKITHKIADMIKYFVKKENN